VSRRARKIWLVTFMDEISATPTTRPVSSSRSRTHSAESITYVPGIKRHPC